MNTAIRIAVDAAFAVGAGAIALGLFTGFVVICAGFRRHEPERHAVDHHPFTIIDVPYDWAERGTL